RGFLTDTDQDVVDFTGTAWRRWRQRPDQRRDARDKFDHFASVLVEVSHDGFTDRGGRRNAAIKAKYLCALWIGNQEVDQLRCRFRIFRARRNCKQLRRFQILARLSAVLNGSPGRRQLELDEFLETCELIGMTEISFRATRHDRRGFGPLLAT